MVKAKAKNRKPNKQQSKVLPVPMGGGGLRPAYTHNLSLVAATDVDKNLRGDPYLPLAKVQYVSKNDYTTVVIEGERCTSLLDYSSGGNGQAMRVAWVPPMIVKQPDKGQTPGGVFGDERGVFADIGVTKAAFKNVTKQPLKILVNSPRGRITDPGTCYLRRYKREIEIPPGKTKWFSATWGDHANIFTPLTGTVGIDGDEASDKKTQFFAVMDFCVVVPEIDEMSGKTLAELKTQSFVELKIVQRFISTASYKTVGGITFEQRNPIFVLKLNKISDMMVESPIILSTALSQVPLFGKRLVDCTVLHHSNGEHQMDESYEGRLLVLAGVGGYFKVIRGRLVYWDVTANTAAEAPIEPIIVAPGCRYDVLPNGYEVRVTDIISFLTTVTKILTVVAAFA